jgi:hypothetical protein
MFYAITYNTISDQYCNLHRIYHTYIQFNVKLCYVISNIQYQINTAISMKYIILIYSFLKTMHSCNYVIMSSQDFTALKVSISAKLKRKMFIQIWNERLLKIVYFKTCIYLIFDGATSEKICYFS